MHCRNCEYPLWNLTARQCPECGLAFCPQDYQFQPGRVAFCCPGCGQDYYGTSETGHLLPAEFDCVRCRRHLHEDEMVLRPAEGVADDETGPDRAPWLQRDKHGWFKGWLRTVGWSLTQQQRLIRGVPPESSISAALGFVVTTFIATLAVIIVPIFFIVLGLFLLMGASNQGAPPPSYFLLVMTSFLLGVIVIATLVSFALIALWGALTHGLLRLTGPTEGTLRRTYQALCYSAGTYITTFFPCGGQQIAMVWWLVSATIMVRAAHSVSGWRAALATLLPPLSAFLLLIGSYITFIAVMISRAGAGGPFTPGSFSAIPETRVLAAQLQLWANDHGGQGPAHALQMVPDGEIGTGNFISADSMLMQQDVPAGDLTLNEFQIKGANLQRRIADELAAAQPADIIAHRVGDFVFTYHGIDFNTAPGDAWIVMHAPDPGVNPPGQGIVYATVDGTVTAVRPSEVAAELEAQNDLRASMGLAPLPPPETITHEQPAVDPAESTPEG